MRKIQKAMDLARRNRANGLLLGDVVVSANGTVGCDSQGSSPNSNIDVVLDDERADALRLMTASRRCAAAEAYRLIRSQLLGNVDRHGWRSVAFVSTAAGEGKTLLAANLALSISRDPSRRVLLCDMDLRNPGLMRTFGLEPTGHGVERCLRGASETPVGRVSVDNERCLVWPCEEAVAESSDLLRSARTREVVEALKREDLLLLFDLPPTLAGDDAVSFLRYVDAALLVVCEGRTTRRDLARARELLDQTPIAGVVLNRAAGPAIATY